MSTMVIVLAFFVVIPILVGHAIYIKSRDPERRRQTRSRKAFWADYRHRPSEYGDAL